MECEIECRLDEEIYIMRTLARWSVQSRVASGRY